MAMLCDACGNKYGLNDGQSSLRVEPPRPSMELFRAYAAVGKIYEAPDHLALDLCRACTIKVLATLGLPTTVCDLPEMPVSNDPDPEPPLAGALTVDELRALGIDPGGTHAK